ncbi:MAG: transglycosylase domain-containing protein [Actinomycetota bacterium]
MPTRRTRSRPSPKTKRSSRRRRGIFRRFWWLLVPLAAAMVLVAALTIVYVRLSIPKAIRPPQTTLLMDRQGDLITSLHAEIDRTDIKLAEMPGHLQRAVVAAEDAGFYSHNGVSPLAILRAAWVNLTSGQIAQGGSTITQQYVKNAFTGPDRTIGRKVEEALLAIKLEGRLSKREILERYLNTIYLGHGAYGVQAAARTYFGVPASDLRPIESATIAGVIKAPENYDPIDHPVRAKVRRNYVLSRMEELGMVSPARARALSRRPVRTTGIPSSFEESVAAYFVDHVKRDLLERYGAQTTFTGGLRVQTTLDLSFQRAAEEAVLAHLGEPGDPAVALVAVDPATGEIRAMVGGRDFRTAKVNLATGRGGSGRQAGSAFKPFTLVAALEEGISLRSRFAGPASIEIDDSTCSGWGPENYEGTSYGVLDVIQATALSVNTVFAQLIAQTGPENVVDAARKLGVGSELQPVCSITLGSEEVTPLEMTSAYATLAAGGIHHEAVSIRAVRASGGKVLERSKPDGEQVLEPNVAAQVTYALQRVIADGTGRAAAFGPSEIAGKTGTTNDNADAWFCGYTPLLAACVWVGYPEGRVPMTNVHGIRVTGGTFPALIWRDFMAAAHSGVDIPAFPEFTFTGEVLRPAEPHQEPPPGAGVGRPRDAPSEAPQPGPSP